jgi:hypothetical protein
LPDMANEALNALVASWITTALAISLLVAAVALSRVWDGMLYLQALRRVLSLDM